MSRKALPVLYSFRRCPYAMRARLAVAASGQLCELREVSLRDKPAALLGASPKGTVPVWVTPGGEVLDESLDIMLRVLGHHDPQALMAPTKGSPDDMLALIEQNDTFFKARLDRYKYPRQFGLSPAITGDRDLAAQWLEGLNTRLEEMPFLFGAHASLADMALGPFVRQFAHVDRAWFAARPWPALQAWLDAFLATPLFQGIMRKYPVWTPGSTPTLFPDAPVLQ